MNRHCSVSCFISAVIGNNIQQLGIWPRKDETENVKRVSKKWLVARGVGVGVGVGLGAGADVANKIQQQLQQGR
jgi:hypothetical protein